MNDNILIVDDDPVVIQLMGHILEGVVDLRFATSGEHALVLARECPPDLILLDAQMPGMSGFQVFDALQTEPCAAGVPVIFVTSHSEAEFEACALEMGAADFIAKPFIARLVQARVKAQLRIKSIADELRRNATVDALTGIANRRHFDATLEREWLRTQRDVRPMSLLLLEVDHFESYGRRYTDARAGACLRQMARALNDACQRPADLVARGGGEEFMVLLPHTPRTGAEQFARRLLGSVALLGIRNEASPTGSLTVSMGVACYDEASECWSRATESRRDAAVPLTQYSAGDLVLAADMALQAAKRAGRAQAFSLDIAAPHPPEFLTHMPPPRNSRGKACA